MRSDGAYPGSYPERKKGRRVWIRYLTEAPEAGSMVPVRKSLHLKRLHGALSVK